MSTYYNDADVRARISILRLVMIFGIVVLHTPEYVNIADLGPGWFDLIKAFFQSAVFRCTVPVLTCISGYLLFSSEIDTNVKKLAAKKFWTLAIPFVTCNALLAIALYVVQSHYKMSTSYQLYPFDLGTMLDAAFGLTKGPVNYPLNFVRDLLVLMMLAPLLGAMLRQAAVPGLVLVVLIFWLNMDGYLILRSEMPIMFYIGGMAAVKNWNIKRLDKYAKPCLLFFMAACVAVVWFRIANTTALRIVSPVLIWPASALLSNTKSGQWLAARAKYSFFIFLLHAPLLLTSFMLYKHFSSQIPYEGYWLLTPLITTWVLVKLYKLGMASMSGSFSRIFGIRTMQAGLLGRP